MMTRALHCSVAVVALAGVLIVGGFVSAACSPTAPDQCKATEAPLIEPRLRILFVISDFLSAYQGPVEVVFEKHYCDGLVSGSFRDFGNTAIDGSWTPVISPQFKLANTSDFVRVILTGPRGRQIVRDLAYDQIAGGVFLDEQLRVTFQTTLTLEF